MHFDFCTRLKSLFPPQIIKHGSKGTALSAIKSNDKVFPVWKFYVFLFVSDEASGSFDVVVWETFEPNKLSVSINTSRR